MMTVTHQAAKVPHPTTTSTRMTTSMKKKRSSSRKQPLSLLRSSPLCESQPITRWPKVEKNLATTQGQRKKASEQQADLSTDRQQGPARLNPLTKTQARCDRTRTTMKLQTPPSKVRVCSKLQWTNKESSQTRQGPIGRRASKWTILWWVEQQGTKQIHSDLLRQP